ncbi:sensor histidine kinase [Tessaracoccus massiliensis]|uniref:sensor histidine kinase n=1 Tax=Tessaracoccus massiliensis TaxID=1522311 RepID=UPI000693A201|nr:ATP-binding protein [Tessaracoccus massiliensis]
MHPAVAGLIGAALALVVVLFIHLVRKGLAHRRLLAAQGRAEISDELRSALDLLHSGALLVGPHDEILHVNEPGVVLNLARGSRVGFATLLDKIREVRVAGEVYRGPLRREMHPGAEPLELSVGIGPLHDDWVLVVAEDESRQRRVDAVRRDFVANISHELKTPIGALSVLAEAVEAASDDPEAVQRFAGRLQHESSRLAELVNQIIDLSRLQSEDPMLSSEVIDVHEVVTEAVGRSQELAKKRQVSLIVARTSSAYIVGDRWQLADAISNLVQNAINYSDERARVTLSILQVTDDGDRFVEIKVSDNGIGIKPEEQERIFERFYRVDYGRSRDAGGTGLGLSIVRHIAMAHGGSIRVWSRPGQGSTFTLRIPAYLGPDPQDPLEEDS